MKYDVELCNHGYLLYFFYAAILRSYLHLCVKQKYKPQLSLTLKNESNCELVISISH